jgi:hypothetical protein
MNNPKLVAVLAVACFMLHVGVSSACEAYLSCDSIQEIHVGKGMQHLADGKVKIFYCADVTVDTATSNLKEVFANCPHDTIVIRIGDNAFELPKAAISTGGNWFGVDCPTPQEALDAAMKMCPDKVKSHLP